MRFFLIALAVGVVGFGATPVCADYKSEYRAYREALEAGNDVGAMRRAEAAWRQAEMEIGEHATTAVLAYNFAALASAYAPEIAVEAYSRALSITQKGLGALSETDLNVRLAEARLLVDPENATLADALADILDAADPKDVASADAQAFGWKSLAAHYLQEKKYRKAAAAADHSISIASTSEPDIVLLREALLIAGVARIANALRTEREAIEAVAIFDKAFPLYPPQKDIDHFNPMLAQTMAWRQSIKALAESYGSSPLIGFVLPDGEDLKSAYARAEKRSKVEEYFVWENPHPKTCPEDIWAERKPPRYPAGALRKGNVGAILIGYDLDDAGVERTVTLADFSEAGFGAAALQSMKEWKLRAPIDPACRENQVTIFTFLIH